MTDSSSFVAVIGGGPAGLMAAERISRAGHRVVVFDGKPSFGRKFLMAGVGGMNITHSEPIESFQQRYFEAEPTVNKWLNRFGPDDLRAWIHSHGIDTFVGSSGRVFPTEMKAAPLLRKWLQRLKSQGVDMRVRHRWLGFAADNALVFETPEGEFHIKPQAVVFALGGGSWSKLGSDGVWQKPFAEKGIVINPLKPSNCGFDVAWSAFFSEKFAGQPLKSVAAVFTNKEGEALRQISECVVSKTGIEGTLVYAHSARLREDLSSKGAAALVLDLAPNRTLDEVKKALNKPRGSKSLSNHLRAQLNIDGVKAGLLHEFLSKDQFNNPDELARKIKSLSIPLLKPRPIDEAISTAGGVAFSALSDDLMLNALPGFFCAGEMLDWEAPTGGYLLTACFASGLVAGEGVIRYINEQ